MRVFLSLFLLLGAPALVGASETAVDPGERIKAKGDWVGENRFEARSMSRKDRADDDFEITGALSEIDRETGSFRIESIWILPDEDALDRRTRRIARRFEPGDWIKAEGEFDGDGRLVADSLERLKGDEAISSIEGLVESVEPSPDGTRSARIGPVAVTWGADALPEEGR